MSTLCEAMCAQGEAVWASGTHAWAPTCMRKIMLACQVPRIPNFNRQCLFKALYARACISRFGKWIIIQSCLYQTWTAMLAWFLGMHVCVEACACMACACSTNKVKILEIRLAYTGSHNAGAIGHKICNDIWCPTTATRKIHSLPSF